MTDIKTSSILDCLSTTEKAQSRFAGLFAAAVINKRVSLNLTQKEFAKKINKSQAMVSKLESGEKNLTVNKLIELCNLLDIDMSIVLNGQSVKSDSAKIESSTCKKIIQNKRVDWGFGNSNMQAFYLLKNELDEAV